MNIIFLDEFSQICEDEREEFRLIVDELLFLFYPGHKVFLKATISNFSLQYIGYPVILGVLLGFPLLLLNLDLHIGVVILHDPLVGLVIDAGLLYQFMHLNKPFYRTPSQTDLLLLFNVPLHIF